MHLTPTEIERLTIFTAAELARRYRASGIRLSAPEATALLADEIITAARRGLSHPELVALGARLLGPEDVVPGVGALVPVVSVEVMMAEGIKLVTVFDPIGGGDVSDAPGAIVSPDAEIELNPDRARVELEVMNTGDRTIQVRSHAHFFEANPALDFDRAQAFGMRLDVPSGGGVRFEPGIARAVTLVAFAGRRAAHGFAGLTDGGTDDSARDAALARACAAGYKGA
ncbi:MAG: urease subunit beta [Paracoccaceae bacterium]